MTKIYRTLRNGRLLKHLRNYFTRIASCLAASLIKVINQLGQLYIRGGLLVITGYGMLVVALMDSLVILMKYMTLFYTDK